MFKIVIFIALSFNILTANWFNKENTKSYPTYFELNKIDDKNITVGTSGVIYKGEISRYSQDGILWFSASNKKNWHINPYPKNEAYIYKNELYKLNVNTPLFKEFKKELKLPLERKKLSYDDIIESVYELKEDLKISLKNKKGRLIIVHRGIMNDSLSMKFDYKISIAKFKTINFISAYNPYFIKKLNSRHIDTASKEIAVFDIDGSFDQVVLKFSKPLIGNIYFQDDLTNNFLIKKDIKKLQQPKELIKNSKINNTFENSGYVNFTDGLQMLNDKYYYSKIWKDNFKLLNRYTSYKMLYPNNLPFNSYVKDGKFLTKTLLAKDESLKEISVKEEFLDKYISKIESGLFIGVSNNDNKPVFTNKVLLEKILFDYKDEKTKEIYYDRLKNSVLQYQHKKYNKLIVETHTDQVGSKKYNKNLSLQRAISIREAIISLGVKKEDIILNPQGESKPIYKGDDTSKQSVNRRALIFGANNDNYKYSQKLSFSLPKGKNHFLKLSVAKIKNSSFDIYVDDKKYGTFFIDDKKLIQNGNIFEYILKQKNKSIKEMLQTVSIEFMIKEGSTISFDSKSANIPPLYLQIKNSKQNFFTQEELIEIFNKSLLEREELLTKVLFDKTQYSNNISPLYEQLILKANLFERSIDKESLYEENHLDLVPQFIKYGDFTTAIKISKFFISKFNNNRAKEYLNRIYKNPKYNNDITTLKSFDIVENKNIKNIKHLRDQFLKNGSNKLSLLSSIGIKIDNNTYQSAFNLGYYDLAEKLKNSFVNSKKHKIPNIDKKIIVHQLSSVAKLKNITTGLVSTAYISTPEKVFKFSSDGNKLLKITTRKLIDDKNSSFDDWLYLNMNDKKYISPLYSSQKSQNIKLENIKGFVSNSKTDYIYIPKGRHDLTLKSSKPILITASYIDDNTIKDTFINIEQKTTDDLAKITKHLFEYEKSANQTQAIEGMKICIDHKNDILYKKVCQRIARDLNWEVFEEFISHGEYLTKQKPYGFSKSAKTTLKRSILDTKKLYTLVDNKSKVHFKVLKDKEYIDLKVNRTSYIYFKQSTPMYVTIKNNDLEKKIILKKGEERRIRLSLKNDINDIEIEVNCDDIGTFANISIDDHSPYYSAKFQVVRKTDPIKFVAQKNMLYKVVYENGEEKYIVAEDKNKIITIKSLHDRLLTIYKLNLNRYKPYEEKILQSFEIKSKPKLKQNDIKLFKDKEYIQADISKDSCLDMYGLSFNKRSSSSQDTSSYGYEKYYQINKDISCKEDSYYWKIGLVGRKHLDFHNMKLFGINGKIYHNYSSNLKLESIVDIKTQEFKKSIYKLDLSIIYDIYKFDKFTTSLKTTAMIRKVPSDSLEYIDKDIYTTYKADHKAGIGVYSLTSYYPYYDSRISLKTGGFSNEDLSLDNISLGLGYRQLFNSFETNIQYDLKRYLKDNNRDKVYNSKKISFDIKADLPYHKKRWQLYINNDYDLDKEQFTFSAGVKFYFNQDPFYKHSYPASEYFKDIKTLINWEDLSEK